MSNAPTPAQQAFIAKLAADLKVAVPVTKTKKDASQVIESFKAQRDELWAAERAAKKAAEADAMEAVTPLPTGRVKFAGEVVATKVTEGMYGTAYKMLVRDDEGRKVWMTVPQALMNKVDYLEEAKGRRVSGVVTLKPKEDEPWFAFGSRPAGFGFTDSPKPKATVKWTDEEATEQQAAYDDFWNAAS